MVSPPLIRIEWRVWSWVQDLLGVCVTYWSRRGGGGGRGWSERETNLLSRLWYIKAQYMYIWEPKPVYDILHQIVDLSCLEMFISFVGVWDIMYYEYIAPTWICYLSLWS